MAELYNIARMTTATEGTGTVTLGSAVDGALSFDDSGVQDGDVVSYVIQDGNDTEVGRGTYTTSGTTLSRDTVLNSTNSGSKVNLSGNAQVAISVLAEDLTQLIDSYVGVVLHDETLGGTGRFDVSSISQDYDDLEILAELRGDVSATSDSVNMYVNNDTTDANYRNGFQFGGNSTGGGESDNAVIGNCSAADSVADDFSFHRYFIVDYKSSKRKMWLGVDGERRDATAMFVANRFFSWENTDAIDQITVQPDGYATDEFVAGSRLRIIGWKKMDILIP